MSSIWIVDNNSLHTEEVVSLCQPYGEVQICKVDALADTQIPSEELVILTGGPVDVVDHQNIYRAEIELVKDHSGPLIGICLGFELIVTAYGLELTKLESYYKALTDLTIEMDDEVLGVKPGTKLTVYESHGWAAHQLPANFKAIADSQQGIEVAKATDRPLWGFQFHPEVRQGTNATGLLEKLVDHYTT